MVVWDIFKWDWLSEGPRTLMFFHQFQDILALKKERHLLSFDKLLMVLPSPSTLFDSWYVIRIYPEIFFFPLRINSTEGFFHHFFKSLAIKSMTVDRQFLNFGDYKLFLFFDDVTDSWVVNCGMDIAFHHCSSFVIFDISFPSFRWHPAIFTKTLLSEIPQGEVISICHQVLNFPPLHLLWINHLLPFNLFINLVPKPLICSVEVMAKKAISANFSCLNYLKQIPPTTLIPFFKMIIDSWLRSKTNLTIYSLGIFGSCRAKMFLRSSRNLRL